MDYLNSLRKTESDDPNHKWIGTYNTRQMAINKFFRWLYNQYQNNVMDQKRWIAPLCMQGVKQLSRKETSRNAMKDLSTSINYGGLSKELNFVPSEESAGLYLGEIIPSKLGTYSLNLTGTIGTQSINNDIQIEDIEDANKITFPIVSDGDANSANLENIEKQITPIINDLSRQFDESKQEMNATRELIQKMNDQINALNSQIERTNILSYIATGLGISAIILVIAFRKIIRIKKTV